MSAEEPPSLSSRLLDIVFGKRGVPFTPEEIEAQNEARRQPLVRVLGWAAALSFVGFVVTLVLNYRLLPFVEFELSRIWHTCTTLALLGSILAERQATQYYETRARKRMNAQAPTA